MAIRQGTMAAVVGAALLLAFSPARAFAEWLSGSRAATAVTFDPACLPLAAPVSTYAGCAPVVYAQPTAAPPSSATVAPSRREPKITESRANVSAMADPTLAKGRCLVAFWNFTQRDVTLKIQGQARVLPRGETITFDLDHQFVWQIDQGDPRTERVPEEQTSHQILIRP